MRTESFQSIGAFEAKTHLSQILEKVRRGARFVITKNGEEVAELKPVTKAKRFVPGCDAGQIVIRKDFDDPLPEFVDLT
jgi:prevent-host-death family protein